MEELVRQNVDVIVTISTPAAVAAKNATSTIPVVAVEMGDPVGTGLAVSLAHPGGNLTGLSLGFVEGMAGKWLELLQETVPRLSKVTVIENPDHPVVKLRVKELEAVAPNRGVRLRLFEVREPGALDGAFQQARRTSQAVLVLADPVTVTHRKQITRRNTDFPLCITGLSSWTTLVGLWHTRRIELGCFDVRLTMWTRSSRAPSPLTCLSSSRPSISSSLI